MMPGGELEAYTHLQPIVEKVAAQVDDGPCVMYIGRGGSGGCHWGVGVLGLGAAHRLGST